MASILLSLLVLQSAPSTAISAGPPIPLCEVLENLRTYDGKTITVQARNFELRNKDCRAPQTAEDPSYPLPGQIVVNAILMESDAKYSESWDTAFRRFDGLWKQGYDVVATVTGRLEVKQPGKFGFGHLGSYSARIIVTRLENMKTTGKKGPRRKIQPIE